LAVRLACPPAMPSRPSARSAAASMTAPRGRAALAVSRSATSFKLSLRSLGSRLFSSRSLLCLPSVRRASALLRGATASKGLATRSAAPGDRPSISLGLPWLEVGKTTGRPASPGVFFRIRGASGPVVSGMLTSGGIRDGLTTPGSSSIFLAEGAAKTSPTSAGAVLALLRSAGEPSAAMTSTGSSEAAKNKLRKIVVGRGAGGRGRRRPPGDKKNLRKI
jgi:hypothetical protein